MRFYKKYPTCSERQLLNDFGEFPPKPLAVSDSKHDFNVVYISGFLVRYYSFSRVFGILKDDSYEIEDQCLKAMHDQISGLRKDAKESIRDVSSHFKGIGLFEKLVVIFLGIIASPIFLLIFLFFICKFAFWFYRLPLIGKEVLAFFSPVTQKKSEIVVKPKAIKNAGMSLHAIISHEHIHLLQFRNFPERQTDLLGTEFKANLKNVLNDSAKKSEKACYYLSLNEVEARLHEVVLSYYRAHQSLPDDYQGFLVMILSCEVLGRPVSQILSKHEVKVPEYVGRDFNLREVVPAEDLAIMLGYFKGFSYAKRFVCESLSVMYGNLLMLYGDTQIAIKYLKTIECSDFYLQLYGEPSVPMDRAGE